MNKITASLALSLGLLASQPALADCAAPIAIYKYLFSNGNESFYFNDIYTIRTKKDGSRLVQEGDFNYKFASGTYKRTGNTFTFTDATGRYTSTDGGPIFVKPSGISISLISKLAPGTTYDGENGVYTKQANGSITFTPHIQNPDIIVTTDTCADIKPVGVHKAVVHTSGVRPASSTYMRASDGNDATQTDYNNGDRVLNSRYGQVIQRPDGSQTVSSPYGTVEQR